MYSKAVTKIIPKKKKFKHRSDMLRFSKKHHSWVSTKEILAEDKPGEKEAS